MSGKEGKLEEGENASTQKWLEMKKDPKGKGSCSQYYWSMGSEARKPVGFLGPAR